MQESRFMMGMPITVEILDAGASQASLDAVFDYFRSIDERFSTYKTASEISRINDGLIRPHEYSAEMREVLERSAETSALTRGYFDIKRPDGRLDPSGLVKGWAIKNAADLLGRMGFAHYYVDVGGDIQTNGLNADGQPWTVGVRNPFGGTDMVKILRVSGEGVATSGNYLRGQHIYDPSRNGTVVTDVVSLTVVGPDIYEADRFATAAYAMGRDGISFIAGINGLEAYAVDTRGMATMTPGFSRYVAESHVHA